MKKVDVLFLYETKVRELENICLLKNELEKRGYSVGIQNTWNSLGIKKYPYKAKVVVTHGMYHDGIYEFVKSLVGHVPKIVNMQCEQVGTMRDEVSEDSRFVLRGMAQQSMNICWGDRTIKRLSEKSGIDERHLSKTGHVGLDFCRKELRGYYLTREQIYERYEIPLNLELNLFISSFAYVNLPEEIENNSDMLNKKTFIQISRQSFKGILEWFSKALEKYPNQAFVYRPHPAEAKNEELFKLTQKYPGRFLVIGELSVKQWIAVANRVYTWYSTASAEVYMFDVPCAILRPVEMPADMEIAIFENALFITDYNTFEGTIEAPFASSISKEVFEQYYYVDETLAYLKVVDAIEKVLKDDAYLIRPPEQKQKFSFKQKCKQLVYSILVGVKACLPKSSKLLEKYRGKTFDEYTIQLRKNNSTSTSEILQIQNKIKEILG